MRLLLLAGWTRAVRGLACPARLLLSRLRREICRVQPAPTSHHCPNAVNPEALLQVAKAGSNSRWYYRNMSNYVSSGSVYFSFLLNVTVNPTTTDEFMGTMIASTAANTPDPTDPLSFHARKGGDTTHFDLGIQRLNGTTSWTGDLTDNTTYLVVLKYTFGSIINLQSLCQPDAGQQ